VLFQLLFNLLAVTINLFNAFTAPGATRTAHHASGCANIANTLHAIKTARPCFDATIETAANILVARRATLLALVRLGKVGCRYIPNNNLVIDGCVMTLSFAFFHWYTLYEHFFTRMLNNSYFLFLLFLWLPK